MNPVSPAESSVISVGNMISGNRDDKNGLDIEMFRVPPISLDDIPDMLLCKFLNFLPVLY